MSLVPSVRIVALCDTCRRRHAIEFEAAKGPGNAFADWLAKHPGHLVRWEWPGRTARFRRRPPKRPDWMSYAANADVKAAYGTEAALTITLASLASSASLVAGRESTAVVNTTNLYLDYLLAGKVTTGTTPTDAQEIEAWLYGQVEDTPTYPDVLDGTDSDETITSIDIRNGGLNFFADTATNNTSDRTYWFRPGSVAAAFGGVVPPRWGLWVSHSTGVNLNATGSNHAWWVQPVFATVI